MTEPRTRPWAADEYVCVGQQRLVYDVTADGVLVVRLPGGGTTTVAELRLAGHQVAYPARVRRS